MPGLDRHGPGVGDAGELQSLVHIGNERVDGHALPPLALWLQIDDRLEHLGRGRVGCCRGAASLAEDAIHLGEGQTGERALRALIAHHFFDNKKGTFFEMMLKITRPDANSQDKIAFQCRRGIISSRRKRIFWGRSTAFRFRQEPTRTNPFEIFV